MVMEGRSVRAITTRARRLSKSLREVCGLLVDHGGLVTLIETRNKSKRPCSFSIHSGDRKSIGQAAARLGSRVVGTFHSHLASDPIPGKGDLNGAVDGQVMVIVDATTGELRTWRIRKGRAYRLQHRFYGEAGQPAVADGRGPRLRSEPRR